MMLHELRLALLHRKECRLQEFVDRVEANTGFWAQTPDARNIEGGLASTKRKLQRVRRKIQELKK